MKTPLLAASALLLSCLSHSGCSGTIIEEASPQSNQDEPAGPSLGAPDPDKPDASAGSSDAAWQKIQVCTEDAPRDSVSIESVQTAGDDLIVSFSHGAGCAEHSYGLCYSELWLESDPVQIRLELLHDAHGESCKALASKSIAFDLTPLDEQYRRAYQTESGQMKLSLGGESFVRRILDPDAPVPSWEEIDKELDALNYCETVDDCVSIPSQACSKTFVSKDADLSEITESITLRNEADVREIGEAVDCVDLCVCGLLTCDSGKCRTRASDCEEGAPGEQSICL